MMRGKEGLRELPPGPWPEHPGEWGADGQTLPVHTAASSRRNRFPVGVRHFPLRLIQECVKSLLP